MNDTSGSSDGIRVRGREAGGTETNSGTLPTVALIGGQCLVHEGLKLLLSKHGFVVTGGYPGQDDLPQAIEAACGSGCDVAVLILADSGPFSVFHHIRKVLGESEQAIPLVVLSGKTSRGTVYTALRSGARAYVDLGASPEEVVAAIASAANGKVYLSSAAAELLASDISDTGQVPGKGRLPKLKLSPREIEIVQLLCEGHISKDIAKQLNISPKTVENHRYNIYRKCHVDNIAGLVRHAIQQGMVSV